MTRQEVDGVVIIDDFLSESEQINIENISLGNIVQWNFIKPIDYNNHDPNSNAVKLKKLYDTFKWCENVAEVPMFDHILNNSSFLPGYSAQNSASSTVKHFNSLLKKFPCLITKMGRMKINLLPCSAQTNAERGIPHIDVFADKLPDNSKIGIYYINNSDGDTCVYNETLEQFNWKEMFTRDESYWNETNIPRLTLKAKVSPKRGRLVIFDANLFHAAGLPKKADYRSVINLNFVGTFK